MAAVDSPAGLIQQTCGGWNIGSDIQAIRRVNDTLGAFKGIREKQYEDSHAVLKTLTRRLEISNSTDNDEQVLKKKEAYAHKMIALDREKFSLAKTINELEGLTQARENTVQQLKMEKTSSGDTEVLGARNNAAEDAVHLRLRIYRDLGVELEENDHGEPEAITARSLSKKSVRKVTVETSGTRFFYSNYLWELIE